LQEEGGRGLQARASALCSAPQGTKKQKRRCNMQALKIATIIFNIAMLLWMIVLDCKEKNTGTSVGFKILSLGFGGTIVYLIMN
jgi:hypothetical protein